VRVQSNFNFFIAGPTGEGEEAQKLREKARRIVYEWRRMNVTCFVKFLQVNAG